MAEEKLPKQLTKDQRFQKWQGIWTKSNGRPGWQVDVVDAYLQKYMSRLTEGQEKVTILVTWCGKTLDMIWLSEQGHTVVGVEFCEVAIDQFFSENDIAFTMTERDGYKVFKATGRDITIYCGDMFQFSPSIAGTMFDVIWDHNSLGACNPSQRRQHIDVVRSVLNPHGRILLSHYHYDVTEHGGPPFSLSPELIQELYKEYFSVELVEHVDVSDGGTAQRFKLSWNKRPIHFLQSLV